MDTGSFSKGEESDGSLNGSYYQVNSANCSPDSEDVTAICVNDDSATTSLSTTDCPHADHTQQNVDDYATQLSLLISHRPLEREESLSSISSSILVTTEDYHHSPADKSQMEELKQTLSNLNISMLDSMSSSVFQASSQTSNLASSMIQSSAGQKANKTLEIQFTRSPQLRDLDPTIVFLENKKASGGGDILSVSKLDEQNNVLTIEFKSSLAVKRLLQKGCLSFRNCKLFVSEPISKDSFSLDHAVMILTNVSEDEDAEVIQMFAENLVTSDEDSIETDDVDESQKQSESESDNEIAEIHKSAVFARTFIARFKRDFSMEVARERLGRRPCLNGDRIELIDAYETNIVLIRDSESRPLKSKIDSITAHLTGLFKQLNQEDSSSSNSFSARLIEPFLLIRCFKQDNVAHLLRQELVIDGRTYFTEYFCNFDFFMSEVKRLADLDRTIDEHEIQQNPTEVVQVRDEVAKVTATGELTPKVAVESSDGQVQGEGPSPGDSGDIPVDHGSSDSQGEGPSPGGSGDIPGDHGSSDSSPETKLDRAESERPSFDLDASVDPRVKVLIYWKELYLTKFMNDLTSQNSEIVLNQDSFHIQSTCQNGESSDAASWLAQVKNKVNESLEAFEYIKMPQPTDSSAEAASLVRKISHEKEKVRIVLAQEADQRIIEIYGLKSAVQEFVAELLILSRQSISQPETTRDSGCPSPALPVSPQPSDNNDQDSSDERIKDSIKGLQISHIRVLFVYKFVKQIKDLFNDSVQVDIKPPQGIITFEGKRADVFKSKQIATELVNKMVTRELSVPEADRMLFFTRKEIAFVHWLREKKIKCAVVPNPAQSTLSLNSLHEKEIENCIKAIGQDIISLSIDCSAINIRDESFNRFLDGLRQESQRPFVFVDNIQSLNQFRLAGIREQVNQINRTIFDRFVE